MNLPAPVLASLAPDAPKDQKLMLAQGLIPLSPAIQIFALSMLISDVDSDVSSAAKKTLNDIPQPILVGALKDTESEHALDFYAHEKIATAEIVESILLNPKTSDATMIYLAESVAEKQTNMIINNQVRLLKNPAIAEALKRNSNALKSSLETMSSFLRMNGIILEGESSELSDTEIKELLSIQEPSLDLPPELLMDEHELGALTEEKRKSIYQLIQSMNVSGKVKLALKGNKEARNILIKDSNKVVAAAVIKSPRITDGEVFSICNLRTVHDEVIRIICMKNDWTKNYNIQVALANNPKTPFPVALKFARQLRIPDLIKLSKNKNAPSQLVKIAKELADQKKK